MDKVYTSLQDIRDANRFAGEIFGATLDDLAPQTRKFLERLYAWAVEQCEKSEMKLEDFRFTRREVREVTGMSNTRLAIHIERLVDMEYLVVHGGSMRGKRTYYELIYNGEGMNGEKFMAGLVDVDKLEEKYFGKKD